MPSMKTRQPDEALTFISLKTASLEEIVKQKLCHTLNNEENDSTCLLSRFYDPIEKALIKIVLDFHKGNQIKASKSLGLSRVTLKKKMSLYNINSKSLMPSLKDISLVGKELLVSSLEDLDLTEAAKRKFLFLQGKSQWQASSFLIRKFCHPIEKIIIETCLKNFKGNKIKTAAALGMNRSTLKNKIESYKISVKKEVSSD